MATTKLATLRENEFFGMEFDSGYKRYYVFGPDPAAMFREVVRMYNSYTGSNYNSLGFRRLSREREYRFYLYRFDCTKMFSLDDDCYSMGERGGTKVGEYLDLIERKAI